MPAIRLAIALLALIFSAAIEAADSAGPTRVLIIVGPSDHPPGSHEVAAGGRLMKHCLETAANVPGVAVDLVDDWPVEKSVMATASTVVFIGDTFPPMRLPNSKQNLLDLGKMMDRGCGLVCVHYATGLRKEDVAEDGEHPLLHWMGGYFATKCAHHQSIARIYQAATIEQSTPEHPVSRGWKPFTLSDEPYINNYFGNEGNRPAPNVTPFAFSFLPPEAPRRETVAWGVERPDGGRGFGIVMPHFIRSWKNDDLRRFIMNGIVWTAKRDVPESGVETTLPELATFRPAAVDYTPKPKPEAK